MISNFIVQALKGEDITVHGDGNQTRSFCYVDDTIEAFLAFMETGSDVTGPINIGNPNEVSIRQLAETILAKMDSKSKLVHLSLPEDDPRQRQPDISKAKAVLGWSPEVQFDEGLDRTIAFFRERLQV